LIGSANLALCFLLKKRLHFEPFFEIFIVMAMYAAGAHFYSIHSLADSAPAPAAQFAYCYIWALAFYLAARGAIKAASVIISDLRR
jgi:hypothetical protein